MVFFFFKQKTAYEMRISDWSSDVCSSDLFSNAPERDADRLDREIIEAERRWPGITVIVLLGGGTPAMLDMTQKLTHMPVAVVTGDISADLLIAALRPAYRGYAVIPLPVLQAQA